MSSSANTAVSLVMGFSAMIDVLKMLLQEANPNTRQNFLRSLYDATILMWVVLQLVPQMAVAS